MKSWMLVGLLGLSLLVAGNASAQTCPLNGTLSNKLVCVIPQVYGPFGFGTATDPTRSRSYSPGTITRLTFRTVSLPLLRPSMKTSASRPHNCPSLRLPPASPSFMTHRSKRLPLPPTKVSGPSSAIVPPPSESIGSSSDSATNILISARSMDKTPTTFKPSSSINRFPFQILKTSHRATTKPD